MSTKKKYEIERTLVLSTTHITVRDNDILAEGTPLLSVDTYDEGYRIFVGHPDDIDELVYEATRAGLSSALCDLFRLTVKQKCIWLRLDNDGSTHNELPKFDW